MPEDYESFWKVVRPHRHRESNKGEPEATPLGGALRILQRYAQGLLDAGGTITRGETPSDFEERIRPWADAIQSSGMRAELESLAQLGYPIVEALQQESDVPAALNRLQETLGVGIPEQPRSNSNTLLREAYARGQGQGRIPETDIQRHVQETIRLRTSLLMEIEESTRSAPNPEDEAQLENLRVSQTLTHLANVLYDLGVFCVTENLLNTPARSVELQLELLPNINRQSNPTSIRGFINPDGTIHLSLGFQEQRP